MVTHKTVNSLTKYYIIKLFQKKNVSYYLHKLFTKTKKLSFKEISGKSRNVLKIMEAS